MADLAAVIAQGAASRRALGAELLGQGADAQRQQFQVQRQEQDMMDRAGLLAAQLGIQPKPGATLMDVLNQISTQVSEQQAQTEQTQQTERRTGAMQRLNPLLEQVRTSAASPTGATGGARQAFLAGVAGDPDVDITQAIRSLDANILLGQEQRTAQVAADKESVSQAGAESRARAEAQLAVDIKRIAIQSGLPENSSPAVIAQAIKKENDQKISAETRKFLSEQNRALGDDIHALDDDIQTRGEGFDPSHDPAVLARIRTINAQHSRGDTIAMLVKLPTLVNQSSLVPGETLTSGWSLIQGGPMDVVHWTPVLAKMAERDPKTKKFVHGEDGLVAEEMLAMMDLHMNTNLALQEAIAASEAHRNGQPLPPPESSPEAVRALAALHQTMFASPTTEAPTRGGRGGRFEANRQSGAAPPAKRPAVPESAKGPRGKKKTGKQGKAQPGSVQERGRR